jgi:hypothetical protein
MSLKDTVASVKAEALDLFEKFEAGLERLFGADKGVLYAPADVDASGVVAEVVAEAATVDADASGVAA